MQKTHVYFVRHAESVGNDTRTNLPPEENVLTKRGCVQFHLFPSTLTGTTSGKTSAKHCIYSRIASPYVRTVSTAEQILSESTATSIDTGIEVDANIRERHSGIYEGRSTSALVCGMIEAGGNPLDWLPEGGESKEEVERRLEIFLQRLGTVIDSGNDRKTILVVTHGAVLAHLWHYLLTQDDKYSLLNWKPEFFKVSRNTNYFLIAVEESPDVGQPREMKILVAHGNDHLKSLGDDALSSFFKEDKSVAALRACMQQ